MDRWGKRCGEQGGQLEGGGDGADRVTVGHAFLHKNRSKLACVSLCVQLVKVMEIVRGSVRGARSRGFWVPRIVLDPATESRASDELCPPRDLGGVEGAMIEV